MKIHITILIIGCSIVIRIGLESSKCRKTRMNIFKLLIQGAMKENSKYPQDMSPPNNTKICNSVDIG